MNYLFLVLFLVTSAFGATTGTLSLSGTVASVNEIVVHPNANAVNLNITGGETGTLVSTVDETSNNINGYTITMFSLNSGKLQLSPTKYTNYTISYDGGSFIAPPASSAPVTVKTVSSLTGLTTDTSNVNINVSAYPTALSGGYTDTITFSIVAN